MFRVGTLFLGRDGSRKVMYIIASCIASIQNTRYFNTCGSSTAQLLLNFRVRYLFVVFCCFFHSVHSCSHRFFFFIYFHLVTYFLSKLFGDEMCKSFVGCDLERESTFGTSPVFSPFSSPLSIPCSFNSFHPLLRSRSVPLEYPAQLRCSRLLLYSHREPVDRNMCSSVCFFFIEGSRVL